MVLPLKTPTPPHARAVSCDFDIDASTYDSGMISTVWLSRDFAHLLYPCIADHARLLDIT